MTIDHAHAHWVTAPGQGALREESLAARGWLDAAVAMAPEEARQLQAWDCRRGMQFESTGLQISVGHVDVARWRA